MRPEPEHRLTVSARQDPVYVRFREPCGIPRESALRAGMDGTLPLRSVMRRIAAFAATLLLAGGASADLFGYEVSVAQTEAGRLRHLGHRLAKQNLLFQLHLAGQLKADVVQTVADIDRVIETLERGHSHFSIPAPWTREIREQIQEVDRSWGPLRSIAVANPYDYLRVNRQFMDAENRGNDPLLLRYFDALTDAFVAESEKLLAIYDAECRKTDISPVLCDTAAISGYSAMLAEKATREITYVVAGIDADQNRERLVQTVAQYEKASSANDDSPFFESALSPERGKAGEAARELLGSLRSDWIAIRKNVAMLEAGDEQNFELDQLVQVQEQLVEKMERLGAALLRYANIVYGV